jgi:2-polyprenyl-6-methoxyphenol hydroxylase-like FAD-dependent oxidoreductase
MNTVNSNKPLLIVGAGPVGIVLGLQLQRYNIPHRIIEKRLERQTFSKAFAIHSRSLEIFEDLGVFDDVVAQSKLVREMNIYSNGKRLIHYNFEDLDIPHQYVASIPQCTVEKILEQHYVARGGEIERGVDLVALTSAPEGVSATLRRSNAQDIVYHCPYLIACDGNKSSVRELMEQPFPGFDYETQYIIADGNLSWSEDLSAGHVFVASGGYVMFFPLTDGRCRVVVDESTGGINSENLTVDIVNQSIAKKGIHNAKFSDPVWLSVTKFSQRLMNNYRSGNIFFAGDACHVHSPIGGQGLNTGIQDAYNLGWKLAHTLSKNGAESLLASYNIERRPVAKMVLDRTNQQMKLLSVANPMFRFLRDFVVPKIAQTKKFKRNVVSQAAGFLINYTGSALIEKNSDKQSQLVVGSRMPDIKQLDLYSQEKSCRLFTLLQGTHYSLFIFGSSAIKNATELFRDIETLTPDFLRLLGVDSNANLNACTHLDSCFECIVDNEKIIADKLGALPGDFILVRPDGYVAQHLSASQQINVLAYMRKHYPNLFIPKEKFQPYSNKIAETA